MNGQILEYGDHTEDRTITADVCVVGSGCGGATVAHLLSRQGFRVVVLERGGYYPSARFDQNELNMNARITADRAFRTSADGGTILLCGQNVGGASVHYWADSYRTPADRLALWADRYGIRGHGEADLAPAWDELTTTLNVHPATDPYFNRMNWLFKAATEKLGWGGHRVPQARQNCLKSGHCMQGCTYEAKRSQLVTHLRTAVAQGADILADVEVDGIEHDGRRVRRLQARVIDRPNGRPSGRRIRIEARAYVIAAGGFNSAALLMQNGLGAGLPALGKSFAFNPSPMVHGRYDEEIELWRNIPAAWGVDHFRLARNDAAGRYVEGGYLLMPNQLQPGTLAGSLPFVGEELGRWAQRLRQVGSTIGWIDDDPDELGEIRIDRHGNRSVVYPFGPRTRAMLRDLVRKQIEVHRAAGAREIVVSGSQALTFGASDSLAALASLEVTGGGLHMGAPHPAGGCVMGPDARTSVVDASHRVHGIDNLFVADSSVFPTAVSVDPSFTIMAFSYVAARHVGEALRGTPA